MLRKPAAARPTLKRCLDVFSQPIKGPSDLTPAKNALAEAGRKVAEEQARAEAAEQAENSRILTRVQLQRDAN